MRSVIVIGSGLAGTGAVLALCERGIRTVLLDVGHTPDHETSTEGNLYEYRQTHDTHNLLIGENHEGLANLLGNREVPVKLIAPHAAWVTRGADTLSPVDATHFDPIQSFSLGGLANAWGAGCYRFTPDDLAGFPFPSAELDPYFDRLTREIGIAGTTDDLSPFFGSDEGLLPPLRLGRNIERFYRRYRSRGPRGGIFVGRARIGVNSTAHAGRPVYRYRAAEFFEDDRAVYSPRYTIERLVAEKRCELVSGVLVDSWSESDDGVTVRARDLATGSLREFHAQQLVVAAGAINTAKLVLATARDYDTCLPLLENPAFQIPLVLPSAIGRPLETDAFGLVQLNLVWNSPTYESRLQGSIMEITAPARAEFFAGFPFAARSNLALIRHLLPSMIVMQLFFPGDAQTPSELSLAPDGRLRIVGHPNTIPARGMRPLLGFLARLGAWTVPQLIVRVPLGHAVHYAGCLPMKRNPGRYECHPDGRLGGSKRVYIGDSASFSRLPAKNMSFGMMANAMRVAAAVYESGGMS